MSIIKPVLLALKERLSNASSIVAFIALILFGLGIIFGVLCLEAWIFSMVWELLLIGVFTLTLPTFSFWGYMGVMVGLSLTLNFIGDRLFRQKSIQVTKGE